MPSVQSSQEASQERCAYLGILDFEATCADGNTQEPWDSALQEIIEIPLTLVHVASRQVVDRFVTVVRPTLQPQLTEFCRNLTNISQSEVDAAPCIEQAFDALNTWLDSHRINADNTLLVTCGDWDLKKMWPRQVSFLPALWTPRLFQRWCNLKVIFAEHKSRPATGMMAMLDALGMPHVGHHHRGADDVANLTEIVLRLLEEGATFRCTWGESHREAERHYWLSKLKKARITVEQQERALARMSGAVLEEARIRTQEQLTKARVHAERLERTLGAFEIARPGSA